MDFDPKLWISIMSIQVRSGGQICDDARIGYVIINVILHRFHNNYPNNPRRILPVKYNNLTNLIVYT
jgi:hypothetical protein